MIFRESKPEDFEYMAIHSMNQTVDRKQEETIDYCYTLEDDVPLGLGGFRMITPTVCWCWVDLTEDAVKNLLTTMRTMNHWIATFAEIHGIRRMQAFVRDEDKYIRLVEHLGFEQESVMKQFYDDEDGLLFVRLF